MDVFDLVARIRVDASEFEDKIGKAKGTMSTLTSGVGKGLATVAKAGTAAVSAGVAGVAALTKMGVEGYAQYEQLVGGVDTLFKESGALVKAYAENAYMTSGMSANAYMETVTSFSASLIQSLDGDTAKAAEVADMAITDMSDNANKMGTSIEMIQNAYNGFAKGNFTMLDNLKLGYGGTKEEMQRLIDDANKVKVANGEMADLSIDSFADVSEAIHLMQEEMGIANATANEAATTIEGSLGMMKAAWENLVVGMADSEANMEVLIDNFVESTATAAKNLLPRIEQTLVGIGEVIERLAPVIGEAIPRLVAQVLPTMLSAGISLIAGLVSGIVSSAPGLFTAMKQAIFIALTEVFGLSEKSASSFVETLDGLVRDVVEFFKAIPVALKKVVSLAKTEGTLFNAIWESIKAVVSGAVSIIQNVIKLFTAVLKGDWASAWQAVNGIVSTALSTIVNVINSGLNLAKSKVVGILDGIKSKFTSIWDNCKSIVTNAIDTIKKVMDFSWELPKLKLPHFSISGKFSLNPPSVPTFGISWYRKAYDSAMILGNPTIFGYSAASGKYLGGGDGNGNEIVAGESYLMNLIGGVVESKTAEQNERMVSMLGSILEAITGGNREMMQAFAEGHTIVLNNREFGRAVREYAR